MYDGKVKNAIFADGIMLIDRLYSAGRQAGLEELGPLIVTKDNARKAIFTKLNRGGGIAKARSNKRMVRRGLMTRGNSFVGFSSGQRVVVKARYVKHKTGSMKAGGGAASLRDHLRYISRDAAGKDGEKAIPYDAGVSQALAERRDWLLKNDLAFIQSNGAFALRGKTLQQLDLMEVHAAGRKLAEKFGLEFSDKRVKVGQPVQYGGFVTLETGTWAVVSSGKSLQLALVEKEPQLARGDAAVLKEIEGKMELQKATPAKAKSRGKDKDQEMEL